MPVGLPLARVVALSLLAQLSVGTTTRAQTSPPREARDFLDTRKGFTREPGRNVGARVAVPLVLTR